MNRVRRSTYVPQQLEGGVDRRLLRSLLHVVAVAAALVVVAGVLTPAVRFGAQAASDGSVTWAAPSGTGSACTETRPCDLPTAVAAAPAGGTVRLLGGRYGDVTVSRSQAIAGDRITIRNAPGAKPTITRLSSTAPYLVWRGLRVTRTMYVRQSAHHTTLTRMHFDGGGLFLRADHTVVTRSLLEGGHSIDGIQVSRANHVILRRNTIRDYDQSGTGGYHADCVQLFDVTDVSIHHNDLGNCYNAGIIFSGGSGWGISNVRITANFVRGCVVKSARCNGGTALDLRESGTRDVVVRNNTFAKGGVRLGPVPGLVFDRNIVGYLSVCDGPMTNSVVELSKPGLCTRLATDPATGMRMGTVAYRDVAAGDLRLRTPASARIEPVGGVPNPTDHDGDPMPAAVAGADAG